MVTKGQVDRLKRKLNINDEKPPGIFIKGKDGEIKDIDTGKTITDKELQKINNRSSLPTVILVRSEKDGYKKAD